MTLTEQFLQTQIPQELYHYTSVNALRGILSEHAMRCTDASHMNDTTELTHTLPLAMNIVESFIDQSTESVVKTTLRSLISEEFKSGFLSQVLSQYFLMCFTTLSDDLPQWRSYANDANGVCIAFNLRELRPPEILDTMVTFAPCGYDTEHQTHLLKSLVADFTDRHKIMQAIFDDPAEMAYQWANWQINNPTGLVRDFKATFPRSLIVKSVTKFRLDFVRLCCHFKNPHFASEHEWRLVLPHMRSQPFRRTVIGEVNGKSYVNFLFEGFERLPISGVTLGSCADEQVVQSIITETGYSVPLIRSSIPYRSLRRS
jgi:hypothetical protein